jgi:predicted aspartyl protease
VTRPLAVLCAVSAIWTLSCVVSPSLVIEPLPARIIPDGPPITAASAEEALRKGRFIAVQRYLEQLPRRERESSASLSLLLGRALAARGDVARAIWELQVALNAAPLGRLRPEIEWALAQVFLQSNELGEAARYTEDATSHGQGLAPGFVRFLREASEQPLYRGWPAGQSGQSPFEFGAFELIRLPVRVNAVSETAVLDSGASYCIVTRSFARRAGLREIPESDAWGRGLQQKRIPLTFGVIDRLDVAGLTVENVPVMIMPDDALYFETPRGPLPVPVVLGLHLLKEFRIRIDYAAHRIALTRIVPGGPKADAAQNLFFVRGKVLVRVSADLKSWHPFLLDTGSELTMLTSAGVRRMGLSSSNKLFPRQVFGIGHTRVEWGKVRKLALGLDGALARLTDVVVAEVDESVEDGIVGSSFLSRFRVTIDFETMKLSLEPSG